MLKKTRYVLTVWYALISLLISASFSLIIYVGISSQLENGLKLVEYRKQNPSLFTQIPSPPFPEPTEITARTVENRMMTGLLFINGAALLISSGAGYFLAGKSLKPVKTMIDRQNQFISDASHELRAPITTIRTELEVASMNDSIGAKAQKILHSNLEEIIHLQELANSLLELNQFEQGKSLVQFAHHSLLDISEYAISEVLPIIKQKDLIIDNQFQDTDIFCDKMSFTRLFTILLENAAKYSDKNKMISLKSHTTKDFITMQVIDQGIGIKNEDKKHIFERFYRADKSRSRQTQAGYGLGLAIAYSIVQRHSGSISVTDNTRKGSIFSVTLPLFI